MGSLSIKEFLGIARALGARTLLDQVAYSIRQRAYAAPWQRTSGQDVPLGGLLGFKRQDQTVDLMCTNGVLRLEILAADLVRFRLLPAGRRDVPLPFSYALDPDAQWPPVDFDVQEVNDGLEIHTEQITCCVSRVPCRLSLYDADGQPLSEAADGLGFRGNGAFCTRQLVEAEAVYGLAEKAFDLNLRGHKLEMWNRDPAVYSPGEDPINLNIPVPVALR